MPSRDPPGHSLLPRPQTQAWAPSSTSPHPLEDKDAQVSRPLLPRGRGPGTSRPGSEPVRKHQVGQEQGHWGCRLLPPGEGQRQ